MLLCQALYSTKQSDYKIIIGNFKKVSSRHVYSHTHYSAYANRKVINQAKFVISTVFKSINSL